MPRREKLAGPGEAFRPRSPAVLTVMVVAVAVTWASPGLASNGAYPITTSTRAAGRGGAEIALGDDGFALISNPAGLSATWGYRIDLGLSFRFGQVTYTNALNRDEVGDGFPSAAPAFAVVWDFEAPRPSDAVPQAGLEADSGLESAGLPLDIGLALYAVGGGGRTDADFRTAVFPQGESERGNFVITGLAVGGAYRVGPRVSVGLSVTAMYMTFENAGITGVGGDQTAGLVRNFVQAPFDQVDPSPDDLFEPAGVPVTWTEIFDNAGAPNSLSTSRIDIEDASGVGVAATLGFLVEVTDWLTLGLTYRSPGVFSDVKGEATLDSSAALASGEAALEIIQLGFLGNHLPDDGVNLVGNYDFKLKNFRLPQMLGLGVAVRPHARVLFVCDVKWLDWSAAFDEFDVLLSNGDNRDLNEITSNQTSSSIETQQPMQWRDQWVFALGAAFAVNDWVSLRLGWNYGKNPVPRKTEDPFSAASVEHHAAVGLGFSWERVRLDLAFVHTFVKARTINNSVVNEDFNGIRHKADQDTVWLGLSYVW